LLPVLEGAADSVQHGDGWRDIDDLRVLPPVQPAGALYAAGANYRQHVLEIMVDHRIGAEGASKEELLANAEREIDERAANGEPYVWSGAPSSITGAYDDVILPSRGDDHDWELDLGVVIGRRCHNVAAAEALNVVAGYTICNDLTTRSLVPRRDIPMMGTDWMRAKNAPTFFPTGPYLV